MKLNWKYMFHLTAGTVPFGLEEGTDPLKRNWIKRFGKVIQIKLETKKSGLKMWNLIYINYLISLQPKILNLQLILTVKQLFTQVRDMQGYSLPMTPYTKKNTFQESKKHQSRHSIELKRDNIILGHILQITWLMQKYWQLSVPN